MSRAVPGSQQLPLTLAERMSKSKGPASLDDLRPRVASKACNLSISLSCHSSSVTGSGGDEPLGSLLKKLEVQGEQ